MEKTARVLSAVRPALLQSFRLYSRGRMLLPEQSVLDLGHNGVMSNDIRAYSYLTNSESRRRSKMHNAAHI